MRRCWIWLGLAILLGASPVAGQTPTGANEDLARARFLEGRAAYDAGDYERAWASFQASYALSQHPKLLYNLGVVAQKLGKLGEALDSFEAYLAWGQGDRMEEVRGRVTALRDMAEHRPPPKGEQPPAPSAAAKGPAFAPARLTMASQQSEGGERLIASATPTAERSSRKGWWIGAGVVLGAIALSVAIAVPLSQRDGKKADEPKPNTGLTVNALRWAP